MPSQNPGLLRELAVRHGTDKTGAHNYTAHYEKHLSPLRDQSVNLLEIGVGGYHDPEAGGASLRMWRDYFQLGNIVGLDFYDKSKQAGDRIKVYQGDQTDAAILYKIVAECGKFDIIIDDGSHENDHIIRTFNILFPLLKTAGIYVIEDVQTSYWPAKGGTSDDLDAKGTAVGYFRDLVHGLNYKERHSPGYQASVFDETIVSISFYHNLVFVEKGDNTEESNTVVNHVLPESYR